MSILHHGIIYIKNMGISIYYCYPVLAVLEHLSNINSLLLDSPDPHNKSLQSYMRKPIHIKKKPSFTNIIKA